MNSLESLPVIEIDGEKYSVADWLALYSLIVYRNHPGNDRIASLFSNMIMSEKTNFAQQYVDSIGELDFETSSYSDEEINRFLHEELFFDYEAAKYKTAKTYSYRQAENIKDSEYFINTEDNIPVYYTRKKGETAKEYNLFGFLSGDKKVVNKRRSNIAKDGVLFIPNLDENNELFNLIRDEKYGDVIKELEYLRKLAIQIKC
jgi:hypothetical protein